MYKIKIYQDKNGNSEIIEYITKLNKNNIKESRIKVNKIIAYIDLLETYGFKLGENYIKKITKTLWELRPLRDRILFASIKNNEIILLTVFMKQTQKTPKKEIKKAENYLKDYLKRSENK